MSTAFEPSLDVIQFEFRRFLKNSLVKPIRSLKEWMVSEFIIPDGKYVGDPFRLDVQPIAGLLFDEVDSEKWTEVFVTGPSQSGKTLIAFCAPVLYHTLELGEKYVLGIPDMRMADNKWKLDLLPIIQGNPRLERLLPTSGPGSQGGTVKDTVTFRNGGVIKFMSAGGTDQQRAGFTSRVVGITEAARFSRVSETSKEADPLRQLRARQASYDEPERMLYVEGTVTIKEDLPWSAKADSSDSRIVCQCVHCGEYVELEREHLLGWHDAENANEAGEKARWYCYECGEAINEEERKIMVAGAKLLHAGQTIDRKGVISGVRPPTNRLFFRYSGFHNLFVTTATLAREEWRAHQIDHETIEYEMAQKELCQFKWCVPYEPTNLESIVLQPSDVVRRKADGFSRGIVPEDMTHLALGVDVGKYMMHYTLLAGRKESKLHVCDFGVIDIPTNQMDWEAAVLTAIRELMQMVDVGWTWQGTGEQVRPGQILIDLGYEQDAVYKAVSQFVKVNRNTNYQFILGRGASQMDRMRVYVAPTEISHEVPQIGHHWHLALWKRWRTWRIFADVDYWKDRVHDSFKIPKDSVGAMSLFHANDRELAKYSKHMTSEHRVVQLVPGKGEVVTFEKKSANHWFDSNVYARIGLDRLGWRAEKLDSESR